MWVFDDARVGLVQEPFVSGADTWIDRVVADIPDAENGFTLIFSNTPFPGHQYRLDWRRAPYREITDTRSPTPFQSFQREQRRHPLGLALVPGDQARGSLQYLATVRATAKRSRNRP
jgi:hypothetical protein